MGWAESGGMGAVPLSATEIHAWAVLEGIKLEPWEFRLIRAMSSAYVGQSHNDEDQSEPWVRETKPKPMIGRLRAIAKQINRT